MKITQICTYDEGGGAARAANRLHTGLLNIEQDSTLYVSRNISNDRSVVEFTRPKGIIDQAYRFLRGVYIDLEIYPYRTTRRSGFGPFTNDKDRLGIQPIRQLLQSDIVHLHWVSGFIDYGKFFSLVPRDSKIVWTMHDVNALTGGCHCNLDCNRFLDQCGSCPQLGSNNPKDLSRKIWHRKEKIFSSIDPRSIHIVAPSKWMLGQVQQSPLLNRFPATVISNGLDLEVFRPRDRRIAREFLGINQKAKVILFVAASIKDKWKGFAELDAAMQGMESRQGLTLVSVGRKKPDIHPRYNHIHLGTINNDHILSQVYSAADLFVIPSLQETFGNTALESIACGVPVVGFNVGGIPDIVRPGKTGLLVNSGDTAGLQRAIEHLLDSDELRESMSQACRKVALEEYSMVETAGKHEIIYEELLR